MANVDSYGQLVMQSSQIVPLANTALTEATEDEIQTDANFVGAASPAGTFATQTTTNINTGVGDSSYNDNVDIDRELNDIVDFTENNPFGEDLT